ncbi:hypothetical protein CBL_01521 [Carabus blaptoides fortunei]
MLLCMSYASIHYVHPGLFADAGTTCGITEVEIKTFSNIIPSAQCRLYRSTRAYDSTSSFRACRNTARKLRVSGFGIPSTCPETSQQASPERTRTTSESRLLKRGHVHPKRTLDSRCRSGMPPSKLANEATDHMLHLDAVRSTCDNWREPSTERMTSDAHALLRIRVDRIARRTQRELCRTRVCQFGVVC